MTKTPEVIVVSAVKKMIAASWSGAESVTQTIADVAGEIETYVEQRVQEALSERQTTSPKEPTKLEQVARALYERYQPIIKPRPGLTSIGLDWGELNPGQKEASYLDARAAIEALKVTETAIFIVNGYSYSLSAEIINSWLSSIQIEDDAA